MILFCWIVAQGAPNNENTVVVNNGVTKFADPPGGGLIENNYEGLDVKEQMIDVDNHDFRLGFQLCLIGLG